MGFKLKVQVLLDEFRGKHPRASVKYIDALDGISYKIKQLSSGEKLAELDRELVLSLLYDLFVVFLKVPEKIALFVEPFNKLHDDLVGLITEELKQNFSIEEIEDFQRSYIKRRASLRLPKEQAVDGLNLYLNDLLNALYAPQFKEIDEAFNGLYENNETLSQYVSEYKAIQLDRKCKMQEIEQNDLYKKIEQLMLSKRGAKEHPSDQYIDQLPKESKWIYKDSYVLDMYRALIQYSFSQIKGLNGDHIRQYLMNQEMGFEVKNKLVGIWKVYQDMKLQHYKLKLLTKFPEFPGGFADWVKEYATYKFFGKEVFPCRYLVIDFNKHKDGRVVEIVNSNNNNGFGSQILAAQPAIKSPYINQEEMPASDVSFAVDPQANH